MEDRIRRLREMLDHSDYTVALCGTGVMEESGYVAIKKQARAYEIEELYGDPPEETFPSAYFTARPAKFFQFYRQEILNKIPEPAGSSYALAAMERAGRLQCVITTNKFEQERRAGCENVIELHGSVFQNRCPHCGEYYTVEDMKQGGTIPKCRICGSIIRPLVSLYGEMVDSRIMTRTTEEIGKAQVLLLIGTTLQSEIFSNYIRYYSGNQLVVIHREEHYTDQKADMALIGDPGEILAKLNY